LTPTAGSVRGFFEIDRARGDFGGTAGVQAFAGADPVVLRSGQLSVVAGMVDGLYLRGLATVKAEARGFIAFLFVLVFLAIVFLFPFGLLKGGAPIMAGGGSRSSPFPDRRIPGLERHVASARPKKPALDIASPP
jgi:hypothetical protein